jgi:hypothetical protein
MTPVESSEIELEPRPASVGQARRFVSGALEQWGLEDIDYDVSVVVSELVTNAVLHAGTAVTVRLVRNGGLRIEVSDGSRVMPITRNRSTSATTGRGLHLIQALATAWGCTPTDSGKVIWAEFDEVVARGERTAGGPSPRPATIRTLASSDPVSGGASLRRVA